MEHTPGPWSYGGRSGWIEIIGANREEIGHVNVSDGADEPTFYPEEANARLIAAAPDLLAALCGAMVIIETCGWPEGTSARLRAEFDKRREAIRTAIAKATGNGR